MRTTIDIPDWLFRRIKALAAFKGITLKEFITRAIEHEMSKSGDNSGEVRITGPLVPSDKPGSLNITSEDIAKLLEIEDLHVPT